jgi:uncharacterized protein YecT (DUF1311 family)
MSKIVALMICTMITVLPVSRIPPAQSQAEMNQDACRQYKNADTDLNKVYNQILSEYKADTAFVPKLKAAQRAWLAFRDAQMEALYPEPDKQMAYGSVFPMCHCTALTRLTKQRTQELRQWLKGESEGDVCSGSIKIKN